MNRIQFIKVREVKSPTKAYGDAAGTDFYIPDCTEQFFNDLKEKNKNNCLSYLYTESKLEIVIPPGEQVNIPSGIKMNIINKNTYLQMTNKSGVASKKHLDVMANTIDADYLGEVHLNLCNNGNTDITIESGEKIVQGIHKEYIRTEWEEISLPEFNLLNTERGEGGFGSSGIK